MLSKPDVLVQHTTIDFHPKKNKKKIEIFINILIRIWNIPLNRILKNTVSLEPAVNGNSDHRENIWQDPSLYFLK